MSVCLWWVSLKCSQQNVCGKSMHLSGGSRDGQSLGQCGSQRISAVNKTKYQRLTTKGLRTHFEACYHYIWKSAVDCDQWSVLNTEVFLFPQNWTFRSVQVHRWIRVHSLGLWPQKPLGAFACGHEAPVQITSACMCVHLWVCVGHLSPWQAGACLLNDVGVYLWSDGQRVGGREKVREGERLRQPEDVTLKYHQVDGCPHTQH